MPRPLQSALGCVTKQGGLLGPKKPTRKFPAVSRTVSSAYVIVMPLQTLPPKRAAPG